MPLARLVALLPIAAAFDAYDPNSGHLSPAKVLELSAAVCFGCQELEDHSDDPARMSVKASNLKEACFEAAHQACEYTPDEVDPAESQRVKHVLRAFSFCIGWTATKFEDVSYGAVLRLAQWRGRRCSATDGGVDASVLADGPVVTHEPDGWPEKQHCINSWPKKLRAGMSPCPELDGPDEL